MQNFNTRKQRDPGTLRTHEWLAAWFDAEAELRIDRILIPCPDLAKLRAKELARYERFRSGNQSELHTYLKFAAFRWLETESKRPDTIRAEVICYWPDPRLCEGIRSFDSDGTEFDIRSPQVLPAGSIFPLSFGDCVRVDLHASDISVEIGGTRPFNLLMPMLEGLADRALWIPYPDLASPRNFDSRRSMGSVNGYLVEIAPP